MAFTSIRHISQHPKAPCQKCCSICTASPMQPYATVTIIGPSTTGLHRETVISIKIHLTSSHHLHRLPHTPKSTIASPPSHSASTPSLGPGQKKKPTTPHLTLLSSPPHHPLPTPSSSSSSSSHSHHLPPPTLQLRRKPLPMQFRVLVALHFLHQRCILRVQFFEMGRRAPG